MPRDYRTTTEVVAIPSTISLGQTWATLGSGLRRQTLAERLYVAGVHEITAYSTNSDRETIFPEPSNLRSSIY
jgi:hypothetical protein